MTKNENRFRLVSYLCSLAREKTTLRPEICRMIQVALWDSARTKDLYTGMITTEALKLPPRKRTQEHYYGTKRLAQDLLDLYNPTSVEIEWLVSSRLKWNYTTPQENTILQMNGQDYSKISPLVRDPNTS